MKIEEVSVNKRPQFPVLNDRSFRVTKREELANFNKINLSLPANRTCFNPTLSPVKGERSGSTVRQLISSLKEITHNEQPKIQYLNLQSNQQTVHTKPPTNFVFEGPNKVFMQHKSDNLEE